MDNQNFTKKNIFINTPNQLFSIDEQKKITAFSLIKAYGNNSNSFLTLYDGFQYFFPPSSHRLTQPLGTVAYMDTNTTWVGAADPLCHEQDVTKLLISFRSEALKHGKSAILLPVNQSVAKQAHECGYGVYQIGAEPLWDLEKIQDPKAILLKKLHPAKELLNKGAVVEEFQPLQLSSHDHIELDAITQRWLASRKFLPLGFLNQVEPWQLLEFKKFYWVKHHGHILGFLAAIPVLGKNSWYLMDLIRDTNTPHGVTELLVLECMQHLKAQGVKEITLGMSPLAHLPSQYIETHPIYDFLAGFIFKRMDFFYNFKTLYLYKKKFDPTRWEPLFLISSPSRLKAQTLFALSTVCLPKGIIPTILSVFQRFFNRVSFFSTLMKYFSNQIVFRPPPKTFYEFLLRISGTSILFTTTVLFFLMTTDRDFKVRQHILERYGFSMERFISESGFSFHYLKTVLLSGLVHWDFLHLSLNLCMLVLFCGFFELIAGTFLMSASYALGTFFANFITAAILTSLAKFSHLSLFSSLTKEIDIGCSLGVFSCMGALFSFLKKSWFTQCAVVVIIGLIAWFDHQWLAFSHLTAFYLSFFFIRIYAKKI